MLDGGIIHSINDGIAGWSGRDSNCICEEWEINQIYNINEEIPFEALLASPMHHVSGA